VKEAAEQLEAELVGGPADGATTDRKPGEPWPLRVSVVWAGETYWYASSSGPPVYYRYTGERE
jgi:hypothetical protein